MFLCDAIFSQLLYNGVIRGMGQTRPCTLVDFVSGGLDELATAMREKTKAQG